MQRLRVANHLSDQHDELDGDEEEKYDHHHYGSKIKGLAVHLLLFGFFINYIYSD